MMMSDRIWRFENSTLYRYYRIVITATSGGGNCSINEVELKEVTVQNITLTSGISTTEAFGTTYVEGGDKFLTVDDGIASTEAFGTPLLSHEYITLDGIESLETVSEPLVWLLQTIAPTGIDSAETFGATEVVELLSTDLLDSIDYIDSHEWRGNGREGDHNR